jgi:hypothetical protein
VDAIDRFTVRYEAQIETLGEQFTDHALVPFVAVQRTRDVSVTPPVITSQVFFEDFLSDLAAPEPRTTPGRATGGGQIANGHHVRFDRTEQPEWHQGQLHGDRSRRERERQMPRRDDVLSNLHTGDILRARNRQRRRNDISNRRERQCRTWDGRPMRSP